MLELKTTQFSGFYSFTINLRFVYCTVLENAWKTALTHLPYYSTGQVAGKLEKPRLKASKFWSWSSFCGSNRLWLWLSLLLPKCDYISINTFLWLMHKIFKLLIFKMQECLICFALCVAQCAKRDTSKCAFPLPSSIQIKKKKNIQQAATNPLKKIHQHYPSLTQTSWLMLFTLEWSIISFKYVTY